MGTYRSISALLGLATSGFSKHLAAPILSCPLFELERHHLWGNHFGVRVLSLVSSPQGALLMKRIAKKPNQDGTFTVYLEAHPVAWGLNSSAADALIERLMQVSPPIRWIL
jgi:hypothetical protein